MSFGSFFRQGFRCPGEITFANGQAIVEKFVKNFDTVIPCQGMLFTENVYANPFLISPSMRGPILRRHGDYVTES